MLLHIYIVNKKKLNNYICMSSTYTFYGQGGADKILFEQYNINYRNGTFIEVGGYTGISLSNTYFYEKELNWSGVLIEPGKSNYTQLLKNRPNARCFNYAIDYQKGELEFLERNGVGACKSYVSEGHATQWQLQSVTPQICKSAPMRDIVTPDILTHVDLFSIDVEGHELAVLETFDWSIPVRYILIEKNSDYNTCKQFLTDRGFVFRGSVHINDLWEKVR